MALFSSIEFPLLPSFRLTSVALLLACVGLVELGPARAQTRSLTLSLGARQGRYSEDVTREFGSQGLPLGLSGYQTYYRRMSYFHEYVVAGGEVAYRSQPEATPGIHTFGIGLWAGRERVGYRLLAPGVPFMATPADASTRIRLYDFNPYAAGRFRLGPLAAGFRAGLHVGRLRNGASLAADSSLISSWLAPDAQLWVGIRKVLYAQLDSGVGMLALGNHTSRFGLGSGLGAETGRFVLAGMAVANHSGGGAGYNMGFLSANIPLGHTGLQVEPYAASNFSWHHQLSLLLHYQLPAKTSSGPAAQ